MTAENLNFRLATVEDAVSLERLINTAFRNDKTTQVFLSSEHERVNVTDVDIIIAKINQADCAVLAVTDSTTGSIVAHGSVRKMDDKRAYHNFHNDFLHIQDPNERRRLALAEIDKAPFGWYHVRACVVAGVGFFTDSYDIFVVSLLNVMLGIVYFQDAKGKLPQASDNAIKLATSAGTVVGQLGFGYLADHVGRKKMYGLELIVIIFATIGQALASGSPSVSIVGLIIFWRVLLGVGIGGDYPLSSIITSEFATTKWRGAMMGAVFAQQGIGQLTAAFVMLFLTLGFKQALSQSPGINQCDEWCAVAVDKMWRALVGFGAVPAAIALYYRLTIPETPR
ncbi:hypothetical protein O1611_g5030 [Lasiodiplodia mahajangana]|uniref:Uncharacterized protein n=1 Tax=Lasiodiplodia mahajangana TaxID=1108764 RepID=A0ACC2JM62_9PEZI|nr:hypothetical protein O1611_g5030 [Lasiodiplodia mahajangana]